MIKKNFHLSVDEVRKKLHENGIGTRPFFYPLHLQPIINKKYNFKKNEFKNSEYLSKNGFYIPSGMKLKKNQLDLVILEMKKIFN